ncbi:MAG: TonB C-terminal domain-containing protein [Candidatus Babeliales bacterium]
MNNKISKKFFIISFLVHSFLLLTVFYFNNDNKIHKKFVVYGIYSKKPTHAYFKNPKTRSSSDWLKIRKTQVNKTNKQTKNNSNNKTKINKQNSKQKNNLKTMNTNSKTVNAKISKNNSVKINKISEKIKHKQETKKQTKNNLQKNIKSNIRELKEHKINNKKIKKEKEIKKQESKIEKEKMPEQKFEQKPKQEPASEISKQETNKESENLEQESEQKINTESEDTDEPEDQTEELCFNLMGESDPKLIIYQKHIQKEVERLWKPPVGIPKGTECALSFQVNSQGKIENFEVIKKSNILIYDLSIIRIAKRFEFEECLWGKKFTIEFRQ